MLTEFKSAGHFPIDFYGTRCHRYHPLVAIKNNANICKLASHLTATSILIFFYIVLIILIIYWLYNTILITFTKTKQKYNWYVKAIHPAIHPSRADYLGLDNNSDMPKTSCKTLTVSGVRGKMTNAIANLSIKNVHWHRYTDTKAEQLKIAGM